MIKIRFCYGRVRKKDPKEGIYYKKRANVKAKDPYVIGFKGSVKRRLEGK